MDKKAQWSLVAAAWVLAIGVIGMGVYAIRHFSGPAPATNVPGQVQSFGTPEKPLCPVDHVEVIVGPDTPKVSFNGNAYYFCGNKDPLGRAHKTLFLMDPLLYLTGVSTYATPVSTPGSPSATTQAAALSQSAALALSSTAAANPLTPSSAPLPAH